MNVLLAPFLYVMPSELEAFQCFCYFIEYCCPTYVQPSLSGVHKGLKVRGDLMRESGQRTDVIIHYIIDSSWTSAYKKQTRFFTIISSQKGSLQRFMALLVSKAPKEMGGHFGWAE